MIITITSVFRVRILDCKVIRVWGMSVFIFFFRCDRCWKRSKKKKGEKSSYCKKRNRKNIITLCYFIWAFYWFFLSLVWKIQNKNKVKEHSKRNKHTKKHRQTKITHFQFYISLQRQTLPIHINERLYLTLNKTKRTCLTACEGFLSRLFTRSLHCERKSDEAQLPQHWPREILPRERRGEAWEIFFFLYESWAW